MGINRECFFWPKFAEKWILGLEFLKSYPGFRISFSKIPCSNFQAKWTKIDFFGPNLPKNEFWGSNFKNLSPDLESVRSRKHVCQFSVNFKFFGLNLEKLPNQVQYFGSNNVEGVEESWVEVEMFWVEVDGAGWRWMDLKGGGCIVQQYPLYTHCDKKFVYVVVQSIAAEIFFRDILRII